MFTETVSCVSEGHQYSLVNRWFIEPGVLLANGGGLRGIAEMNVDSSFGVYNYIAGDVFICFCLICCRSQ